MKPTRLPSVPPIEMTGGPVALRVRWRYFRAELAAAINTLARIVAGH